MTKPYITDLSSCRWCHTEAFNVIIWHTPGGSKRYTPACPTCLSIYEFGFVAAYEGNASTYSFDTIEEAQDILDNA